MRIQDILEQLDREGLENYCRSKTQYAYLGEGEALTRVLGKYLMYVDTRDVSLAPHLIHDGFWESWITQALTFIQPGTRCIDVGANHGYYSLVLAELSGAEVFAFEPQEKMAQLLRKTANVNGFKNQMHVVQAAVGSEEGFVSLVSPPGDPNSLGGVHCTYDVHLESRVRLVSLDDAVPGPVGFIKIDAEGFEPGIWAGMQRHLQSRPTILMEFTPAAYVDPAGFLAQIESCYTLREVDTNGSIVPVVDRDEFLKRPDFSMLWLETD